MIYYVSCDVLTEGCGTKEQPFRTISQAAAVAVAGDTVMVAPGVYREYVNPLYGGTDDEHRITYVSQEPLGAVITGAEEAKAWTHYEGDVWVYRVNNRRFGDYNPYTLLIKGDWLNTNSFAHAGEVYLNGRALYEEPLLEAVLRPAVSSVSWEPEYSLYKWYTEQDGEDTVIYANFQGKDPCKENVEINVRRNCFYPDKTGVNYITLSGFTVKQAATTWAPPTAYQEGMIGPHWAKGWIIEDCEISDSKCCGISLGKYLQPNNDNKWTEKWYKDGTQNERDAICQAQNEGWSKETIGSHIVRRCHIHDCGQTGIVGHLGCVFSLIEDNHIHHINNKQELIGAEIGGIKLHAAIDVTIRRNHFHHCTRGLWLDWQAQGTRVSQNLFHDNVVPKGVKFFPSALGEDLFIEVSHGPTLVDNNILLSECAVRINTQGIALVHNLIAGSFTHVGDGHLNGAGDKSVRFTPYHVPHRTEVAGFMTILHGDARFYNNIFVQQEIREDLVNAFPKKRDDLVCGTACYEAYPTAEEYFGRFTAERAVNWGCKEMMYYGYLPVYTGGNVYFNGAAHCSKEENCRVAEEQPIELRLEEENGKYTIKTNLYKYLPAFEISTISTDTLGEAFEPEQKFEASDGSPIVFDCDYFGKKRGDMVIPGPFAGGNEMFTL